MTPNIKYINQSAPFWDWIASFEQSAAEHPFFGGAPGPNQGSGDERGPPQPPSHGAWGPWAGPWGRRHNWHGGMPHHGGPPHHDGAPPEHNEQSGDETMKDGDGEKEPIPDPPEETPGCPGRERRHGRHGRHGHGHCGGKKGRGGFPFGGHHHHPYGGRGGWGMPGRGGFRMLSEMFGPGGQNNAEQDDWKPEADVFDTETAFVVHISLPGAHKEDVGVTWDAEKSELTVAGVVHRPGDEAFLKALALDERKVGAFERKVRLGTRAVPAHVDVEGITAKLENGILIVDVPKLNGEFVEVKKVDIE
jgi:HSP20 family protein